MKTSRPLFLAALLARHYPEADATLVAGTVNDLLLPLARQAKRHGERECSDQGYDVRRGERRLADRLHAAQDYLQTRNLVPLSSKTHAAPAKLTVGGDPRGPCAHLEIPGMPGDGWGDHTYAIYG